jgi:hypothetical protein
VGFSVIRWWLAGAGVDLIDALDEGVADEDVVDQFGSGG